MLEELEKISNKILLLSILVLLLQVYNIHYYILGKLLIILIIVFIVMNNKYLGFILTIISLFLNYKVTENMETMEKSDLNSSNENNVVINNANDVEENPLSESIEKKKVDINAIVENPIPNNEVETNDAIATFKKIHCKNGKILDKDGKEIHINDLSKYYPAIKFELENNKCNPCDNTCKFKLTSSSELLTVQENLRPISSATVSSG
jgi:hypothetical protein